MQGVVIERLGGTPVSASGMIDGTAFIFRVRGCQWSIDIGEDATFSSVWAVTGIWGGSPVDAEYMPTDIVQAIIEKAAELYRVSRWDDGARARLKSDFAVRYPAAQHQS